MQDCYSSKRLVETLKKRQKPQNSHLDTFSDVLSSAHMTEIMVRGENANLKSLFSSLIDGIRKKAEMKIIINKQH